MSSKSSQTTGNPTPAQFFGNGGSCARTAKTILHYCDMPSANGDILDKIVWEGAKIIIENPDNLRDGLPGIQNELDKLLDLYLSGDFPKDVLTERKTRLESMLANLRKEQNDLAGHIRKVTITDDQLAFIEAFCAKIRQGLDKADFNTKRQIIELLDVRGKIAYENGEKVIYLKCLITSEQQPLLPMVISHSSNIVWQNSVELTARFVLEQGKSIAEVLYPGKPSMVYGDQIWEQSRVTFSFPSCYSKRKCNLG